MKKTSFLLFSTLISVVTMFSCTKTKIGPIGPAGPAGANGTNGNANVKTYVYRNVSFTSVFCASCSPVLYKSDISVPAITSVIVDSGTVQVALATPGTNVWTELPLNSNNTIYSYYYIPGDLSIVSNATVGQDIKVTVISN